MHVKLETLANTTIVFAALAVGGAAVHREFAPGQRARNVAAAEPPTYVKNWRDAVNVGILAGDPTAKVVIVEFADFECPYCKKFHEAVERVRQQRPSDVAIAFVHYPLAQHRFARPAARAAECAANQGRFEAYASALYARQDSLGLKAWSSYARDAGIRDTVRFDQCAADTARIERIENGVALGAAMKVHGTPTVIVNGFRYAVPPNDSIAQVVDLFAKGRLPSSAAPPR